MSLDLCSIHLFFLLPGINLITFGFLTLLQISKILFCFCYLFYAIPRSYGKNSASQGGIALYLKMVLEAILYILERSETIYQLTLEIMLPGIAFQEYMDICV